MAIRILLFLLFVVTLQAHNHSIIFLVDGSTNIGKEACKKRQEGISEYFQTFYDLKANNVLSYMTFNKFGEINKIIDFGDEYNIPFNTLLEKIKSINCDNNKSNSNINVNNFSLVNSALKLSLSTFDINDIRTPRILLFHHFNRRKTESVDCYDTLLNINNLLQDQYFNRLVISIVNYNFKLNNILNQDVYDQYDDEYYIFEYYSQCFAKFNEYSSIKPIVTLKDVEHDTFVYNNQTVIYSICSSEEYPTIEPTTYPTKSPSTYPTKSPSTYPTKSPSTYPTKNPSTYPTKNPSTDPTKSLSTDPTKNPSTDPIKSPSTDPTKNPTKDSGSESESESSDESVDAVLFVDRNNINFDKNEDINHHYYSSITLNPSIYVNILVMVMLIICLAICCCLYYPGKYRSNSTNLDC